MPQYQECCQLNVKALFFLTSESYLGVTVALAPPGWDLTGKVGPSNEYHFSLCLTLSEFFCHDIGTWVVPKACGGSLKKINFTLWYCILSKWLLLPFIQEICYGINIGNIHVGINDVWMEMWVYKSTGKIMSEQVPKDWWPLIVPECCICGFTQMTKDRKKRLKHKLKVKNSAGAMKYSDKEKVKLTSFIENIYGDMKNRRQWQQIPGTLHRSMGISHIPCF